MRFETGSLAFAVALGVGIVGFVACGSNVTDATGGTTGTGGHKATGSVAGSGGATASSTVAATASSTQAASSSSGAGGAGGAAANADPHCVAACMHLDTCMLGVTCKQFMFNCANIPSTYDCLLDCVDNTPCSALNFGTISGCMAQCKGDSGMGNPDAGPSAAACQQCAIQQCAGAAAACGGNQQCMGWTSCANACEAQMPPDPACPGNCNAMFPTAAPLYDALYTCTCANCPSECALIDPCSQVVDGGAPDSGGPEDGGAADGGTGDGG